MVAPWRIFGLSLLLCLAAACTTPTPALPTARPTFTQRAAVPSASPTKIGQAATPAPTEAPATETPAAPTPDTGTPDPAATPTELGPADATLAPAESPAAITTATATAGPCTNDVEYIADLSVPDGTQFEPGAPLLKQWSVRNAGTCDWDADYRLVLVSGNALGARSELALYPARAGLEAIIEVAMLAPAEPGSYTGRWQARDPAGNVFGDRIFITIQVIAPATPTETASPTP